MRLLAAALLLTGCANFLAVRRELGPEDDIRYRLGSLPLFGERQVYDDLCAPPHQLAAAWARALADTGALSGEQASQFQQAICQQDLQTLSRLTEALKPEQLTALGQALRRLDPAWKVEEVRGLTPWAQWAIVGAVVVAVGLAISAERTGFFEPGGGRYENLRRVRRTPQTGGGVPGPPGGA